MLPSTGGIGVNIFYATGALLVIGAVFLAVMKGFKR
jgi:LPXTG-motif cell wall-anchored protein